MSKRIVYRLIWMPCTLALIVTFVIFFGHVVTEAAPAAMTGYTMSDKTLQMQHPANWKPQESSTHGVESSVRFVVDEYSGIRFGTDLTGSLQADLDKAGAAQLSSLGSMAPDGGSMAPNGASVPLPAGKSPLQKAHERKGQELEKSKDFENYREGETRSVQVAGQEALATDFTYTEHGMLGDKEEVGRRVTALLGESRLLILARCPKEREAQLMPLFQQMIDSLKVSTNGGQP